MNIEVYNSAIQDTWVYLLLNMIPIFGYDISHANFESYSGEFDYMQVSGNRKDVIDFSRESDLYFRSVADLNINTGVHSGYILYGKTSRWIIAYSNVPFE